MHELPADFDERELFPALAEGWGIAAQDLVYLAVGFGSYHWVATDEHQLRFFVTVDELDSKAWLGSTYDDVFAGMCKAFATAVALRDQARLRFVLAPLPSIGGEPVLRIGRRHSVAIFPWLDGEAGHFGDDTVPAQRGDVVRLLVDLHRATPAVSLQARPSDLLLAGRAGLEAAAYDLDRRWDSGPFAEPARAWLASHAGSLRRALTDFDQLVSVVRAADPTPVVTHGEPHPGNVMRTRDGLVLIDWDTVGLAPPERDLWLVATDSGDEAAQYKDATGHEVDPAAMSLYRRAWELADVAAYVDLFRSPHQDTQDTQAAWLNLETTAW